MKGKNMQMIDIGTHQQNPIFDSPSDTLSFIITPFTIHDAIRSDASIGVLKELPIYSTLNAAKQAILDVNYSDIIRPNSPIYIWEIENQLFQRFIKSPGTSHGMPYLKKAVSNSWSYNTNSNRFSPLSFYHLPHRFIPMSDSQETKQTPSRTIISTNMFADTVNALHKEIKKQHVIYTLCHCPITDRPLSEAMLSPSGHSYELKTIINRLSDVSVDPITKEPLDETLLIPNITLQHVCDTIKDIISGQRRHLLCPKSKTPYEFTVVINPNTPEGVQLLHGDYEIGISYNRDNFSDNIRESTLIPNRQLNTLIHHIENHAANDLLNKEAHGAQVFS